MSFEKVNDLIPIFSLLKLSKYFDSLSISLCLGQGDTGKVYNLNIVTDDSNGKLNESQV